MSRTLIYCVKTRTRGKQLKEDYMDFSVKKEPVFVTEVIYDGQAEQGVDLIMSCRIITPTFSEY